MRLKQSLAIFQHIEILFEYNERDIVLFMQEIVNSKINSRKFIVQDQHLKKEIIKKLTKEIKEM